MLGRPTELDELRREERVLDRTRTRLSKSLTMTGTKTDPKTFEADIVHLSEEVTQLNKQQEALRNVAVREQEVLSGIEMQIRLAEDALGTYERDAAYLRSEPRERLVCPTCGAVHAESFLEILTYAEDARVLRELVGKLHSDAAKASQQLRGTRTELGGLEESYRRVAAVLDRRRGNIRFGEVVSDMGAERAFKAFEDEIKSLRASIGTAVQELEILTQQLKTLSDPKRSKAILKVFRDAYAAALRGLNLPPLETKSLKLTSRPDLSGSGGPRSILAYYAALWQTFSSQYGSFTVPLVVDAPQQQGQDDINLPRVVQYIANELPDDAQVLVGIESDTHFSFDNKIVFQKPYRLLEEEQFEEVGHFVDPLIALMYGGLRARVGGQVQ